MKLNWFLAMATVIFAALAGGPGSAQTTPPALSRPYQVAFNVAVPMRDGVTLNATIIRPARQTAKLPVVLIMTPYGADRYHPVAAYFAQHGYVGAIVEVRGRGDSQGTFKPYVSDGDDGYDAVEWLARQPFADGRVVMRGASYTGLVQWQVAARMPPALKTIVPAAPSYYGVDSPSYHGIGNPYRTRWSALVAGKQRNSNFNEDLPYWRGLFAELGRGELAFGDLWKAAGFAKELWPEAAEHPVLDAYWKAINPTPQQLAALKIPVLSITGAYDGAQAGTLEHWGAFVAANPAMAAQSRLLIGPWNHAGVTSPQRALGGLELGEEAKLDMLALHLAWYDHVLNGAPMPPLLQGAVTHYVIGDRRWAGAASLAPVPLRDYWLVSPDSDGGAIPRAGQLATRPVQDIDSFRYDPRAPAIAWHPFFGEEMGAGHLVRDDFIARIDGNGLIYETPAFARGAEIVGMPTLVLKARYDVRDTDLTAVLYDVAGDGTATSLSWDALRLRYRDGLESPKLLTPGKLETATLHLGWISWRVAPGHRLRLVVTSPGVSFLWQRNRNSGGDVATETVADSRVATIAVQLGRNGSRLALPVRDLP